MKVKVLCTGVMCGNVMIPQGVQDTESLGLKDDAVKDLMKRTSDIHPFTPEKASDKKDEKTGQPQGGSENAGANAGQDQGSAPDAGAGDQGGNADEPKAYDDITGQEMIDFLAKKGVAHELTKAQKKELYPVYTGHFKDPDVA